MWRRDFETGKGRLKRASRGVVFGFGFAIGGHWSLEVKISERSSLEFRSKIGFSLPNSDRFAGGVIDITAVPGRHQQVRLAAAGYVRYTRVPGERLVRGWVGHEELSVWARSLRGMNRVGLFKLHVQ